jgi:large subunit ribosomal protein L29
MPILRVKEIRDMPSEERMRRLGEFRTELLRLKTMVKAGGNVENPARIKQLRKTVARILTIETERKLGMAKTKRQEKKKEKKK